MTLTITRATAATVYTEALMDITKLEDQLLDSPNPVTRAELKELGKLHRKAALSRSEIFRAWNREEPMIEKTPFWKFWK
jgi:hypothetical protein